MKQDIMAYLWRILKPDHIILPEIEARNFIAETIEPNIGLPCGKALALLVHALQANRVLELGTGSGYSTICLAKAAKIYHGCVLTLEQNKQRACKAQETFKQAGLNGIIDIQNSDARCYLKGLSQPFDLIFQDSAIMLYREMFDDCVRLLRPGGVLVTHDALLMTQDAPSRLANEMRAYNEMVMQDKRVFSAIIPLGDGLIISIKETQNASL